jgi:hypothetical protein
MAFTPPFYTSLTETEPKVFHDNSACPEGLSIAPEDRLVGVGRMRIRCHRCADLTYDNH